MPKSLLSVAASIASASALAHILVIESVMWLGLRALTGFCFAGLTMVIESWMNERATNKNGEIF